MNPHTRLSLVSLCAQVVMFGAAFDTAHAAPTDAWAVGAKVPVGGFGGLGSLLGSGALGGLGTEEGPGLVFEHRLADQWWLTFGLSGSISSRDDDGYARSLAAAFGVRWVLNPDSRVRLAPTARAVASLGARRSVATNSDGDDLSTEQDDMLLSLDLGLDVELAVTDGFALRLEAILARVAVISTTVESASFGDSETTTTSAALGLTPTIAAVWSF